MQQSRKIPEAQTATPTIEGRAFPRYPFSTTAEAIDIRGNTRITGRTTDIAQQGCYIDTISPFAPKSAVALKITRDKQSFETRRQSSIRWPEWVWAWCLPLPRSTSSAY